MKNTQTKIFFAIIALLCCFSLFGCIQRKVDEKNEILDGAIAILERDGKMPTNEIMEITDEMKDLVDSIQAILDEFEITDEIRNITFQGNGFTLIYSGYLWELQMVKSDDGRSIPIFTYILDGTEMICDGKNDMFGYSFSKKEDVEALYKKYYDMTAEVIAEGLYISEETKGFEPLKDGVFYAAFGRRLEENDELCSKMYVIASEKENATLMFFANLGDMAKFAPEIPIMPILRSIVFENGSAKTSAASSYEQKVSEAGDELIISGYSIQSLSKAMDDSGISYKYAGQEKTIGKMIVPSLGNFFEEPKKVIVEIVEITYEDVGNAWNAIDAYGGILYNTYGFGVTYQNYDYSNYGKDYYFSELIKIRDDEKTTIYVAAIYSLSDRVIKLQFGLINTPVFDAIGPMNLERIAQENIE
ncbi:MAG: hypothetical protein FWG34_15050 [Oscillospiraceae bacterium]|nr:hypothetical protein [Oscillospiraceae bacterium]